MKTFFLIIFIYSSTLLYSQNYKTLKGKDTVYIYFDYSKQLNKKIISIHSISRDTTYFFSFKENNPKDRIQRTFHLIKSKYLTFEDMDVDKKADIKILTKRFLRKHKAIVIYPKDLQGEKMEKIVNSIGLKTVVYIIDVAEKKKGKFIAREVRLSFGSFIDI